MTLSERLTLIRDNIRHSLFAIIDALADKGVVVPSSTKLRDIPFYIRQVKQPEFEFFFNFKEIDQFGSPHYPNQGQSTGGMTGLNPTMQDTFWFEFKDMSVEQLEHMNPVPGQYGWETGLYSPLGITDNNMIGLPELIFDEHVIGDELHYDNTLG